MQYKTTTASTHTFIFSIYNIWLLYFKAIDNNPTFNQESKSTRFWRAFEYRIFSTTGALVVITVLGVSPTQSSIHPLHFLLISVSAPSNSVLTFPNKGGGGGGAHLDFRFRLCWIQPQNDRTSGPVR